MKLSDILVLNEAPMKLVVLQSGQDYRVDPNPDHRSEEYKNAWTQDISQAHVFKEKQARRFLQRRVEGQRRQAVAHDKISMVPVTLDDTGHPVIPEVEREPSMFQRMVRRRAA